MSLRKIIILLLPILVLSTMPAQSQSRQVRKKIAKAEKVKEDQKKDDEKERKEKIKNHKEMQTPETRKRMKETDKKAAKFNKRDDRTLFNRIFNRQQRKAKKKYG